MPNRTQIVCLHEGKKGSSVDPIFINKVLKTLDPAWLRPWKGNNTIRIEPCGGRTELMARIPGELRRCLGMGGDTTLMVWADLDHDMEDGEKLKEKFWQATHSAEKSPQEAEITREQFDQVVFVFAKDRIENWIEFLLFGATDESMEGPRQKHGRLAADAAKKLANRCLGREPGPPLPPSLEWSCQNWRALVERMSH